MTIVWTVLAFAVRLVVTVLAAEVIRMFLTTLTSSRFHNRFVHELPSRGLRPTASLVVERLDLVRIGRDADLRASRISIPLYLGV
jgi:hypothetical protein